MATKSILAVFGFVELIGAALFAEITDTAVTAFFSFLTAAFVAVMTYFMARLNAQQAAAAIKAAEVKEALNVATAHAAQKTEEVKQALYVAAAQTDTKLIGIAKVTKDTFTLSNSRMGIELRMVAELARWKATSTKNPEDVSAAERAEASYKEHQMKQAIIDAAEQREDDYRKEKEKEKEK